ncbi:MAG: amino acid adenylation domain-containing protein [Legionellales bacterium]|nr:amino acid adenylation domain-containing protein [Legionellales bacterium]
MREKITLHGLSSYERFIENPFATIRDTQKNYTKLYKTGDLVRYLPDGNIEFIERNDFQVKIRGYRIELGEIENALLSLVEIRQCVVIAQADKNSNVSNSFLVAYYVANMPISNAIIIETLSKYVPDYMIPTAFVHLKKIPLTNNGKLDRKGLPKVDYSSKTEEYCAPRNELEKTICDLWSKLLGVSHVGITDNFFQLGGNSILAIQCAHRISKTIGYQIMVSDIFQHKTIASLLEKSSSRSIVNIPKKEIPHACLSFAQERLWFIEQYEEGCSAYHVPMLFELAENSDENGLIYAIQSIVKRHNILSSNFYQDPSGRYCQKISEETLQSKNYIINTEQQYKKQLLSDINTPFDLIDHFPIRFSFYNVLPLNKKYLFINIHHIAFDGWSIDILIKELLTYYNYYCKKEALQLEDIEVQYVDFAIWQRDYLSGDVLNAQIKYWHEKLKNHETLLLPTDKQRPIRIKYKGHTVAFEFSKPLSNNLRKFSKSNGCSLYTVLLTGFYAFLYHYTGQHDIVIGTPIANRHYSQLQAMIGFFVNSVALRSQFAPDKDTLLTLLQKTQSDLIDIQRHQDIPFEQLVSQLEIERDSSKHPLFQIMFGVQSFGHLPDNNTFPILQQIDLNEIYSPARFDLSLFIDDGKEIIKGTLNYAENLFVKKTIERMISQYKHLLESFVENSQQLIKNVSLLTLKEYQQIIQVFNKTDHNYYRDKTLTQLFEEQAAKTPMNIAISFCEEKLTYQELNNRASLLAEYIRKQYPINIDKIISSETLIGLCLDRGTSMIVAMLAIHKAGAGYVPIDIDYPRERIEFIVKDSDIKIIITENKVITTLESILGTETHLINVDLSLNSLEPANIMPTIQKDSDIAYVIYTSGTTGKPKGVILSHQGICNMISAQHKKFNINAESVILQFASLVFDASVWEIFNALTCGARLAIATKQQRHDPDKLMAFIEAEKISLVTIPPALLSQSQFYELPNLKTLVVAGESCDSKTMSVWSKNRRFINAYGPTETSVCATWHHYKSGDSPTIIGRPIQNTKAYILNSNQKPVPIGVIGELYIAGIGLARSYLNRTDLTSERFVKNPFLTVNDKNKAYSRLYKTGDLARYLPDGKIEYMGRNDFQLKIRGHRIEPGEIENILLKHAEIKQCAVLPVSNGTNNLLNQQLVAYYVSQNALDENHLLKLLTAALPDYMIPNAFVHLHEFPITINGKLDIIGLWTKLLCMPKKRPNILFGF